MHQGPEAERGAAGSRLSMTLRDILAAGDEPAEGTLTKGEEYARAITERDRRRLPNLPPREERIGEPFDPWEVW
jgi:hypothetical protein